MADDLQLAEATAPLSFAEFLERMKDPAAADLVRSIKNFIRAFEERKPNPERDSDLVQQFLAGSEGAFRQHPVWAAGPSEHQAQAIEGLEKYLMTKIYAKTFASSELDRERDQALFLRLRALSFVKPAHLDLPEADMEHEAIERAKGQLNKINSYKAPRDKLVCILNCSRIINGILSLTGIQGKARGADDFLPILIYVVIQANPAQLASNLEYIQRYRMKSRMVSESSYFFTQLYSAATFIETINASSLTMDPDEFKAQMIAAGVPDMQLFGESDLSGDTDKSQPSPFVAESRSTPPMQPPQGDAKPAKFAKPGLGARQQTNSAESIPASLSGSGTEIMGQSGKLRSLPELEEAGYSHLLKAEESGALQQRHPFIYASAPDMRVSDVSVLLAAYKRIVLRYESLSLLLKFEHDEMSSASNQGIPLALIDDVAQNLSLRPPAVTGPNPFAGGNAGSESAAHKSDVQSNARSSADSQRSLTNPSPRVQDPSKDAQQHVAQPSPRQEGDVGQAHVSLETLLHRQQKGRPAEDNVFPRGASIRGERQKTMTEAERLMQLELEPQEIESVTQALNIPPVEAPIHSKDGSVGLGSERQSQDVQFKACPVPIIFGEDGAEPENDDGPKAEKPVKDSGNIGEQLESGRDSVEFPQRASSSPFEDAPTSAKTSSKTSPDRRDGWNFYQRHRDAKQETGRRSTDEAKAGAGFEDSPFMAGRSEEAFDWPQDPSTQQKPSHDSAKQQSDTSPVKKQSDPFPESLI